MQDVQHWSRQAYVDLRIGTRSALTSPAMGAPARTNSDPLLLHGNVLAEAPRLAES